MNITVMLGRITRVPKVGTGQSGTKYATFSIAVDRRYSGKDGSKDEADFFDCIAFDRQNGPQNATTAEKHLKPGKPIIVRGEMQNRKWKTQGGEDRVSAQIVVENIEFLPMGKKTEGSETFEAAAPESTEAPAAAATEGSSEFDWSDIS